MSLFVCDKCGCIDNTALTRYWAINIDGVKLCSACDPAIGEWHGQFYRRPYDPNYDVVINRGIKRGEEMGDG